jgi:hypothetical protein
MRSCWNLKLSEVIFFCLYLLTVPAWAQFSPDKSIITAGEERSNYLFPIKPGTMHMLTGTMGELRNTHFHAGLDIDTPGGTGVPVLAVFDGYISRASHTTGGYGNVIYITHPDGNTTVYAHLEEFSGALGDYIRQERYARKISEFDFQFKPNQFPVSRGEMIALSGNTGGSGGPHLHFEVRNKLNEAINPLIYGFAEVKDHIAPTVFKIALKTLDANSRINDQFGRFEFSVVRQGNGYVLPVPILASGHIGVEVLAHDKMDQSRFRYGIDEIDLRANDQLIFLQAIDKINFDETRRILTVMDYRTLEANGNRFNKLYVDDGNSLNYYPGISRKNGVTVLQQDVNVEIRLRDFNRNETKVNFTLKSSPVASETPLLRAPQKPIESELIENTMKVAVKACPDSLAAIQVWQEGKFYSLPPAYYGKSQAVYLIDLRKSLPDSIQTCVGTTAFSFKDRIPSETNYTYYSDLVDIQFQNQALYDTTFLTISYDTINKQEFFRIGEPDVPLHLPIQLTLKPKLNYTLTRDLGVYRTEGKGFAYVPAEWRNNRIYLSSRSFGAFTIMRDTIPPVITPVSVSSSSARFRIKDGLSGISYFEASINGEWVLMVYDYKTGYLKSEKLDNTKPLKGDFQLKVVDNAGNEKIYRQKIM